MSKSGHCHIHMKKIYKYRKPQGANPHSKRNEKAKLSIIGGENGIEVLN